MGDSGYPLRKWLMVPYIDPSSNDQERFNNVLSKARVKVEQCFGILKRRWSINKTGYRLSLEKIPGAILSTCILHNIAIDLKIPIDEPENSEEFSSVSYDASDLSNDITCSAAEKAARNMGAMRRNEISESLKMLANVRDQNK